MTLRRLGFASAVVMISAWVLLPIMLIALAAFSPRDVLYQWPRPLWPSTFTLDTFLFFAGSSGVLAATWNSVVVAGLTIALSFAIAAPTGYALARYRFAGRDAANLAILGTKMFPATVLSIPLAVTFLRWGLYDTLLGVAIVHTALSIPSSSRASSPASRSSSKRRP